MSKNTMNWYDRDNPQREAVAKFRDPETEQKQNVMEDFIYFLKYDLDEELSENDLSDIQTLIDKFLGLNMEQVKQVKQGEQKMLTRWIEATKGE